MVLALVMKWATMEGVKGLGIFGELMELKILKYNRNFIDTFIRKENGEQQWKFIGPWGFYS